LEERINAVLAPRFELSYERNPTTRRARYVLRRSGDQYLVDYGDVTDSYDVVLGLGLPDEDELVSAKLSIGREIELDERISEDDTAKAPPHPVATEPQLRVPGPHELTRGICQRCGCSESSIMHFGWPCPPSTTVPEAAAKLSKQHPGPSADEAVRLSAEITRLRGVVQRIVDRYATTSPEYAHVLAWQMQSDAREGLAPPPES
jgi:hypothetical protein